MTANENKRLSHDRREFIRYMTVAGVVGSAGCSGIRGDNQEDTSGGLTIDSFVLSEVSEDDTDVVLEADWAVSNSVDDLESLEVVLSSGDTEGTVDSVVTSLSGSHANGVTRLVATGEEGSGTTYTVRLMLTDITGKSVSATDTITETRSVDSGDIEKWELFELEFDGPCRENPYRDIKLSATFTHDNSGEERSVNGFWDGGTVFRVRFMPDLTGDWSWQTTSDVEELDGRTGDLVATSPTGDNHGPVTANCCHFTYADGTRFYPFGTTCYGMAQVQKAKRELTYDSLDTFGEYGDTLPFNKVRLSVLPHEPTSQLDPDNDEYRDRRSEKLYEDNTEKNKVNPDWFQLVDEAVENLLVRGIQADVILFHLNAHLSPGDFSPSEADSLVRYITARYGAYRNVWWCLSNEWNKTAWNESRWHDVGRLVRSVEFYPRLASIHTWPCKGFGWDADWVTHVSAQRWVNKDCSDPGALRDERSRYGKPYINDEYQYDGDKGYVFESDTPEEAVLGHWRSMLGGAYATHGETYDQEFFRGGGRMHAPSTERIAFMRSLYSDSPDTRGFEPITGNEFGVHKGEQYYLFYYGKSTAPARTYVMPLENTYSVDIIDTWNMTIDNVGEFCGSFSLKIPDDQFIAVRIEKV